MGQSGKQRRSRWSYRMAVAVMALAMAAPGVAGAAGGPERVEPGGSGGDAGSWIVTFHHEHPDLVANLDTDLGRNCIDASAPPTTSMAMAPTWPAPPQPSGTTISTYST